MTAGNVAIVRLLLFAGSSPTMTDKDGKTPAELTDSADIIQLLSEIKPTPVVQAEAEAPPVVGGSSINMAAGRVLQKTVTAISEAISALDVGEDDISNTWQRGWLLKRSRHFNVSRRDEFVHTDRELMPMHVRHRPPV